MTSRGRAAERRWSGWVWDTVQGSYAGVAGSCVHLLPRWHLQRGCPRRRRGRASGGERCRPTMPRFIRVVKHADLISGAPLIGGERVPWPMGGLGET